MKTTHRILTLAVLGALCAAATVAEAQLVRPGAGIGSRLGAGARQRANAAAEAAQPEIQTPQTAVPAATTATPGQTRPATVATPAAQTGAAASAAGTATAAAQTPAKKSDGSEFVIPENATPEEYVAQANALFTTEVAFDTEEEYAAWVAKMLLTAGKLADKAIALNPTEDKTFVEAITIKGQVLCYQATLDPAALARLNAYAEALAKHSRVQSLDDGRDAALAFKGVYLQAKIADLAEKECTAQELVAAMNDVAKFIAAHPETSDMTVDLVYPVAIIAANLDDATLPAKIWQPIRRQLAASDAEQAKAALVMLEGAIRYSELQGKPFEWKGCDPEGKPVDATKLEGRVVLVEFWASWCQPSPLLHQQLAALYKTYHADGFEILSYNLDAKAEDMQTYLKTNAVSGIILSDRATVDANAESLAAYYGISEIPTMILVGGDGNVAAVDITIESLVATLQSVFKKPAPEIPGLETQTDAAGTGAAATGAAAGTRTGAAATGTAAGTRTGAAAGTAAGTRTGAATGTATGAQTARPATTSATSGATGTRTGTGVVRTRPGGPTK